MAPLERVLRAGCLLALSAPLLAALVTSGCYTYRAQAPGMQPKTETAGEVVWAFAWGLVQETPEIGNCNEGALATVTTRNNFGFALITVVTLGLASPVRIEWNCAGHDPAPAVFEAGADDEPE